MTVLSKNGQGFAGVPKSPGVYGGPEPVPGVVHHPVPRMTTDSDRRKEVPIASGVLDYFPDAIAAVAELSFEGNKKHNPNQPLHWNRDKSGDEGDALIRHFLERGTIDTDGIRHSAKVAWRALALLQKEIELAQNLPISRGSRTNVLTVRHQMDPIEETKR